jgi:hypothetical protein
MGLFLGLKMDNKKRQPEIQTSVWVRDEGEHLLR